jgi:hypothetical protein
MRRKGLKMQRDDTDIADFRQRRTVPAAQAAPAAGDRLHTGLVGHLPVMLAGGILAAGVMAALAPAMTRAAASVPLATMTPGSASPAFVPAMAGGGVLLTSLLFIVLMLWGQGHHVRRHGNLLRQQLAAGRSETHIGLHLLAVAGLAIAGALMLALLLAPALHLIVRSDLPMAASLGPALQCALVLGGFALAATLIIIPAQLKRLTHRADIPSAKETLHVA